jgi:hypothetical protein
MSGWKRLSLALAVTSAIALPSFAQTNRATLEGTVMDPSGSTISGASVKILAVDTGLTQERTTNPNGQYRFPGIATGQYTVSFSNSGFKTKVIGDVVLDVGQTRTLDVNLDIGIASEKVDVVAETGPAERSSAEAATVIRTDQIANLPVNGRDWSALTLLAPFAQDDGGGNQRTIRYGGRAIDDNNFNFDGVDAGGIQEQAQKSQVRLQISPDAIAEYRVNSALYDAEYGTQAGGQIDVVTKSGTNDYHGSAFGYLRNSVFDARNFNDFNTDPVTGNQIAVIPAFRMGQYGLTVGGPIVKDNTFFFLSYEGLRQLQSTTQIAAVPSAALLADILVNGRTGVGGPSPQMCSILQVYPWKKSTGTLGTCAPKIVFPDAAFTPTNGDSDTDQFSHQTPTIIHEDTALIRIDHKFSDKTTLYGRAQRDIVHSDQPISPLFDVQHIFNHPGNYFLALQHIFNASIFNEAKVYVNRSPYHNPQASVLPYAVSLSGFTGISNDSEDVEVGTTFGFIDNLTWTRGRHTFKTGMEFRRIRLNQGQTSNNNLSFPDNNSLITASLSKVDYIAPWCCHKYRRAFLMPYFQDEWKVSPTFTANLGIRWDYYGVAHVPDNRTTVFDFDLFHGACLGSGSFNTPFPVPINTPPCPKNPSLYYPTYRNVDPRVSFAWAPSALRGKTVFRTGFGLYSGAAQNDDLNAGLESDTFRATVAPPSGSFPLDPPVQQKDPDLSAYNGANGLSKAANHPRALQRKSRLDQYVESWGLTIDHELPSRLVLSASYLGTHGVHLFSRGAVNLCTIPLTIRSDGNDCIRPLDQYFTDPANPDPYGSVDYKHDVGQSTYHALRLSLERRYSSGFSFQTSYTFSHSINDGAVGGGEANGPQNVNCRQCDKGPSVFDIRHNFSVNTVYELPFGPGKAYLHDAGVLGKIVGGWEVSGLGIWHTGHPLTVSLSYGTSFQLPDGNDQTSQRPDIVPGVPLYLAAGSNGVPQVNPAAFQAPPLSTAPNAQPGAVARFGNEGNGVLRALDIWQVDTAITKETKLTERYSLQFGAQAFNVFNHVQLGDFSNLGFTFTQPTPGSPFVFAPVGNFGQINSSVNGLGTNTGNGLPRQLQFMLRLKF